MVRLVAKRPIPVFPSVGTRFTCGQCGILTTSRLLLCLWTGRVPALRTLLRSQRCSTHFRGTRSYRSYRDLLIVDILLSRRTMKNCTFSATSRASLGLKIWRRSGWGDRRVWFLLLESGWLRLRWFPYARLLLREFVFMALVVIFLCLPLCLR